MDRPNYEVVKERKYICRSDDSKIYELEDIAYSVFSKILDHRAEKYKEDRYRQALPSEMLTFIEHVDSQASLVACVEFIVDELVRRNHFDVAIKVKELNIV